MKPALRLYRPGDRAACAHIFYRAVRQGASAFYNEAQRAAGAPSDQPHPDLPDKLPDQWCWVAERPGRVVGFMSICRDGYLDMACVLPEEMGRGTASALCRNLLAKARCEQLPRLTVLASHLARRFFSKLGRRVESTENLAKAGEVYEVFHMVLDEVNAVHPGV